MSLLTSSGRAKATSAEASRRGQGDCCSHSLRRSSPLLHRLFLLAVTATLVLLLTGTDTHRGGVLAAAGSGDTTSSGGNDPRSPDYIFENLEELNTYTHGLPYAFHHVELAEPRDDTDSRGASAVSAREFTDVAESEVADALRLYTTTTTTTATVAATVEGVVSEPRLSSRISLASSAAQAADANVSAASMCAADFTCPRSSVAWASGSFTTAGLLTPHSLALPLGLQLRLSLCCQYRFDGTLLRSRAVYDAFLQELLQASPFQSLSTTEKRLLFPQQHLYVVDTWGRKQVYNTSYTPTAADVAAHNDGDGDVLVLTTGVLTSTALRKVVSASPSLTLGSRTGRSGGVDAPASGLSEDSVDAQSGDWPAGSRDEAGSLLASTDMQLRITNRVLKCKCPHILTVMPLLHLRRDALPAISIAGLGSHCGVQPTQNRSAAATSSTATAESSHQAFAKHRVRQVRSADGTVAFATSFELQQRLPPNTLVRWTIRTVEEREAPERGSSAPLTSTALRHTRVLPIEVDAAGTVQYSTAASPFFLVEPNVRYAVTADVWRGPLQRLMLASVRHLASEAGLTAEGNSDGAPEGAGSTADATLVSSQHWQHLRVSRSATGRFVLRLPLNRSWPLPPVVPAPHFGMRRWMRLTNATMQHDAVAAALNPQWWPQSTEAGTAGEGASSGGSWFGLGRWVGGAAGASAAPNRTLFHYGYWANAPLTDQLRPQHAWTVKSNPFTDSSPAGVSLPLFLGRNLMAYMVRDVDDVCDPVVLEGHEVWAVQSLFSTAGPLTACGGGETDIAAVVLRDLYQRMRSEARIAVTVPNTSWSVDTTLPAAVAAEGDYRCSAAGKGVVVGGAAASPASPDCWTVADVAKDGSGCFAELHMRQRGVYAVVWTVRVAVAEAQLVDAGNLDPAYATVAARGPANETFLVEVRSDPLLVVRRMTSYPAVMNVELPMHARRWSVAAPRSTASSDGAASGYWRSRLPIRVISVDEHQRAEIDTNDVPNVQQTLPNRTLEFVAQDKGEIVAASTRVGGAVKTITYTSRCPDTVVDYRLVVVAFPPVPILPAYAPIYTEEDCVVLVPPRELRKDEVAEWHVPPCAAEAHDGAGPYLIERRLSAEELEEHAYVITGGDGGSPYTPHATRNDTVSDRHRSVPVLMACGVVVQQRCDVVWTAHNVLAAVHKTYSLRRCQRPPEVLFHLDARQQRLAYPEADVWPLPSLEEAAYVRGRGATSSVSGSRLQRRQRQVIPIAGYEAAVGYSFNYTGLQEHFAMHLSPLPDEAANQLMNTRHDYVGPDEDGVLVLRRRVSVAVQAAQSVSESGTSHSGSGDESDGFWETYADNAAGGPASTSAVEDAARAAQRRLRDQQQSREIDQHLGETYIVVHDADARRLRVAEVGNASLYLMDYAVRGSTAVRTAAAEEDRREFARRGLCVERPGAMAVLALTPRGSVKEDERYGTVLPAPPAPAVAVLPFCAPHYAFARFPELSTVYGYDYTWSCPEAGVMTVTKYHPTYSVLSHTPELGGNVFTSSSSSSGGGGSTTSSAGKAGTLCELTLTNRITQTERRDWFLVQRVYPSPLPTTALIVLSDNAADSLQIVPDATASRLRTARAAQRNANVSPNANATHPTVTVEELYKAPANTYPFAKARRVVGKSVVLHVDAPAGAGPARWAMQSLVPTVTTSVGTQVLLSGVEFRVLHQHPAVVARGGHAGAGSTVHVTGLLTPGLYTVTHTLPDPENPSVCPPVTLTDMLDVFHARVLEKELFVCGDTAALMAVPVPREIAHEFVGQWEVMSLATDESTVWTAGVNFTGIRFERGARAETLVHGLPFGIVTIRWAIYRLLPAVDPDARQFSASATTQRQRVLVDYDAVEVYVLTENLPSNRLVTLADEATILTTSSSQQWRVEEVATSMGGSSEVDIAAAAAVRLTHHAVLNYSHSAITPFLEALRGDEAGRAQFHTYYGLQPRPGSGALTLQHLPIGTTYLRYDVVPSQSLFGRMVGHSCALQGFYEVERVSAYVAATTTLDHECDAYTGRGRITLCLNTDGVAAAAAGAGASGSGSGSSSSRSRGGAATASPGRKQSARRGAQPNAHFWQSQVRLVAPELLEDVVKRGAREVEQRSGGRCATPWWVAPTTRWSGLTYTAASRPSAGVALPGRCATFAVQAGRHLSPRKVAQPLFVAVPRPASLSTPAAAAKFGDAAGAASGCPFHGDFISSRIIDGAPLAEAGQASAATATQSSPPSSRSFLGLSQLFHLGLPHAARDGEGGAGVHFLPVLQPTALRRLNATMRPIIALRGVDDDVTSELSVSGFGVVHRRSVAAQQPEAREAEPAAATVLLRLDLANPRHMGGYTVTAAGPTTTTIADGVSVTEGSLVHRCVEGTVMGADVLQYWSETNRPDGRVDRTAQEWLDYVHAVRDVPVVCDVLFPSLEHLVEEGYDPSFSPPQPADPPSAAPESSSASPPSPQQQRRGWHGRRTRTAASSPSKAAAASSSSSPPYVSLAEMEAQVDRIRRRYRWTADGIDVTGLSPDLQSALSHRRITTTQLRAIEAARRSRQAAEEAAEQQRQQQHQGVGRELENAPSQLTPVQRLARALQAYRGVTQGGEVAVLRVQLPVLEAFTVPYDLFLRTALHKDVVCGTSIDPPPALPAAGATAQPTVSNPHALVALGRLEIRDTPPVLRLSPPVVKQCEVEGGLPVLTFELSGARFAHDRYAMEEVVLEEVANPQLVKSGLLPQQQAEVGLTACVAEMRRGVKAVVEEGSHKRLYVHLSACPFFKMLTPEEYNEHQDSEALLRRLQFSRYLRVTVRRAIQPDSFLSRRSAAAHTAARQSAGGSGASEAGLLAQNRTSFTSADAAAAAAVSPSSTDASFIVEVRPTLARLHLRSAADMTVPPVTVTRSAAGGHTAQASGGSAEGSWWSRAISSSSSSSSAEAGGVPASTGATNTRSTPTSAAASSTARYAFAPTPARPLLVCESDLRRYGFQLGIELIGDTWTSPVGEESASASTASHRGGGGEHAALPRQRAPPNVALINSFSVVEHHSLDSSHHLYLKGGGVYRSHFINYLFSTLLSDPAVLQSHTFVHRYNTTFASVVIPPFSAVPPRRAAVMGDERHPSAYNADPRQQQISTLLHQQRPSSPPSEGSAPLLPAVRQFCKVEEVLFAVPGIATECQGCLLADTTFFVAGDLTGVWSPRSAAITSADATRKAATAAVAGATGGWTSADFTRPLVIPWDTVAAIPTQWGFDWICPSAAHHALERLAQHVGGSRHGALAVVMDVVVYRVRSITGEELPAELRPTVLLSTAPVPLRTVLERNKAFSVQSAAAATWTGRLGHAVLAAPLLLTVNASVTGAAYTQVANDVLRYRRHARTAMDYHRDAAGRLVVNASVFLNVCAGPTACTVVSITDALLATEAPVVAVRSGSWVWRLMGLGGSSVTPGRGASAHARRAALFSVVALLHHAFMAYLCYTLLPLLGVVIVTRARGAGSGVALSESFLEDQQRARLAYTAMAVISLFFSFAFLPVLWTGLCLLLWTLSLYHSRRPELVLLFVASVLYAHFLL